jgi:sulfoxide reductase heme-binding subunit YedZ
MAGVPGRGRALRLGAAAAAAVPLLLLVTRWLADDLGANPIEEITHQTGQWTMRLLLLSLAVTPARRRFGIAALAPLRRTFGLGAFGYASLHLLTYVGLDQGFGWRFLLEDVNEHRFVTAGFAAYLCLVPLALTSTRRAQRRLGRRWQTLHRLVYVAAALAVIHYVWLVKADLLPPLAYAAVLVILLASRLRGRKRVGC